ncbi:MAG TPA: glycosyltransferase family 2 protein [bacterium]|nr:glycosyltransferase family 2 protein [bacterium]
MYNGKRITVIIPALNEEKKIGQVIDGIPRFVDHVVVVDDGSTDRTGEIAREKGAVVFRHAFNRGVGAAFNSGRRLALELNDDIVVNIDADGQFNPADIESLIEPIVQGAADFVTASRFKDVAFRPQMSRIKFWGNQVMSSLISRMTGQKFYDVSCGFRAYSRDSLLKLNLFGNFTYTQETFLNFAFKNIPIVELPVQVRGRREHGKSRVASNLFRYTYQTLKIIIKTLRDYRPFRLFAPIAALSFIVAVSLGLFLILHYLHTGEFTPHKWAGFASGFFFFLSAVSLILGFILDMFARMRLNQEEMLYYLKRLPMHPPSPPPTNSAGTVNDRD